MRKLDTFIQKRHLKWKPFLPKILLVSTLACLLILAPACACPQPPDNFARFLSWFEGEYDNHEQVWQQEEEGIPAAERHEHTHHFFIPALVPALGSDMFFVKQHEGGDYEKVYRMRLYSFSYDSASDLIELRIYRFKDEDRFRYADRDPSALSKLTAAEVTSIPGCDVYWRFADDAYQGFMKKDACNYRRKESGKKIIINDTLRLTPHELWISDRAVDENGAHVFGRDEPHRNRKVRRFKGWGLVQKQRLDPSAAKDEYFVTRGLNMHNEGDITPLLDNSGVPTGYSIELARLTYSGSGSGASNGSGQGRRRIPILKLGVIEDKSGKTVAYTWSDIGATKLGINLRWMQCGLTAVDDDTRP